MKKIKKIKIKKMTLNNSRTPFYSKTNQLAIFNKFLITCK